MKREFYKEMAATAQGRKELHKIMLNEIKTKLETFVNGASEANREKVRAMFESAFEKMQNIGIADLYDFFVGEHLTMKQFIGYTQDLIKGKLYNK